MAIDEQNVVHDEKFHGFLCDEIQQPINWSKFALNSWRTWNFLKNHRIITRRQKENLVSLFPFLLKHNWSDAYGRASWYIVVKVWLHTVRSGFSWLRKLQGTYVVKTNMRLTSRAFLLPLYYYYVGISVRIEKKKNDQNNRNTVKGFIHKKSFTYSHVSFTSWRRTYSTYCFREKKQEFSTFHKKKKTPTWWFSIEKKQVNWLQNARANPPLFTKLDKIPVSY